jgi:hypothetical protein
MRSRAMSSQLCRCGVLGEQLLHLGVGLVDVFRIARERAPAERADAPAEQRADIGRHEAGEGEGVFQPFVLRHLADVVAVIERRHAGVPEIDHGGDMGLHRGAGGRFDRLRIAFLLGAPFGHTPALRQVAVERIMRRGLVGHDVGATVGERLTAFHAGASSGKTSAALPSSPRISPRRPWSSGRSWPAPRRGRAFSST